LNQGSDIEQESCIKLIGPAYLAIIGGTVLRSNSADEYLRFVIWSLSNSKLVYCYIGKSEIVEQVSRLEKSQWSTHNGDNLARSIEHPEIVIKHQLLDNPDASARRFNQILFQRKSRLIDILLFYT